MGVSARGPAAAVWAEGSVPVVLVSRALDGAQSLGGQPGKRPVNSRQGKRYELQCGVSLEGRFPKASGEGGASWPGNKAEVGSGGAAPGSRCGAACRQLQEEQPGARAGDACQDDHRQ